MKISIIGTGRVGSTLGFAVVMKGLANELVLVNRTHAVAVGEALDLCHASTLAPDPIHVYAGNIEDTQGSDIVVLCASVPFGKQYTTRNDLAVGNTELFRQYVPQIVKHSPGTCLLIVTNPVDVMSYVAWKLSELPSDRVIGTGTLIDSMRYRSLLSEELGIDPGVGRSHLRPTSRSVDCSHPGGQSTPDVVPTQAEFPAPGRGRCPAIGWRYAPAGTGCRGQGRADPDRGCRG